MTYCSDCIHYKVCGNEGVDDSAMTYCEDKQTDGDLISRQAVIQALKDNVVEIGGEEYCGLGVCEEEIESIVNGVPSAEKTTITDGDLISRDNAIELVNYALAENKDVLEVLENMPSAEKTAGWNNGKTEIQSE